MEDAHLKPYLTRLFNVITIECLCKDHILTLGL